MVAHTPSREEEPTKQWLSPSSLRCPNKRDQFYKISLNNENYSVRPRIYKNNRTPFINYLKWK